MSLNCIEKTYRRLVSEGKPILKLFTGNPSAQGIQFPKSLLNDCYASYATDAYHPEPKGLLLARKSIATYYGDLDPENILLTSGTSESFLHLFSLLGKPGDNFLVPCPSYPLFDPIAEMTHVNLTPYHLREEKN